MKQNTTILQAVNVSKHYNMGKKESLHVLEQVNLTIYDNEFVSLLGKSGSGKSTLLRVLSGLTPATFGSVVCDGLPVDGPCQDMSMVFQSFALFPWLTVFDNVAFGLQAQSLSTQEISRRTTEMINLIGLSGYEKAYPKEISGGMRQRVGFARALAVEPKILLLDEPFSALDIFTSHKLRHDLIELWESHTIKTRAMVMVTHSIEEAIMMSDRIIMLASNPGTIAHEFKVNTPRSQRTKENMQEMAMMVTDTLNQKIAAH